MGLLRVTGTIDLAQFWPVGDSDADTTKVLVGINAGSFKFQATPTDAFKTTSVFRNAKVVGRIAKPPIDSKGRITIRLQGIDAPELHYQPTLSKKPKPTPAQHDAFKAANKDFRQPYGESSTLGLAAFLAKAGKGVIACTVETRVNQPTDVFDTYGRFVGDIFVKMGGKLFDINQWLVEQGYAYPTFYTTMANDEINTILAATAKGRKQKARLWSRYEGNTNDFDPTLVYRRKGASAQPDLGKAMMPKLFRRRSSYYSQHKAGYTTGDFFAYIKSQDKENAFYLTDDFLKNSVHAATVQFLSEHLDHAGQFGLTPDKMVFKEAKSKLVDSSGKEITKW
jgi:endonuclease YncB( thermonuclease family)